MGVIMYRPDGYMSAQLMRPNPSHFASGDWFKATFEEYGRVASTYFAYAGPFQVAKEDRDSFRARVALSELDRAKAATTCEG
jgi:hypothetical protein